MEDDSLTEGAEGNGAEDPAEGDVPAGEDGKNLCICVGLCSEDAANTDCPVCAEDYADCAYQGTGSSAEGVNRGTVSGAVPVMDGSAGNGIGNGVAALTASEEDGIEVYAVGDEIEDSSGIKYRITGDDEVEVIGHKKDTMLFGGIVIPETVDEGGKTYRVTSIGDGAFSNYNFLSSIEIPEGVTGIGSEAFRSCLSLRNIEIPNSVTSIGAGAFLNCKPLSSVKIPDGVTSIESGTFKSCTSLRSIGISNSVTSIEESAFEECTSLRSIEIPNGVTSIGKNAFYKCNLLSNIEIPNSVMYIGAGAFSECSSLSGNIKLPNGVTSIENSTFLGCSSLNSIEIPESVTSIGDWVFGRCGSLSSVNVPEGITSIGEAAFLECSSLRSINIPKNVINIGNMAFWGCINLGGGIKIPNGVTDLKMSTFYQCTSLSSIEIPNSVTSIGQGVFYGCTGLTSIEIPDSVISIGIDAFWGCKNLSGSMEIPDSVTFIGENAFAYCSNLSSIRIPKGVTGIGGGRAFWDCSKLSTLQIVVPSNGFIKAFKVKNGSVFDGTPADRSIVFLAEDGSLLTGDAFTAAKNTYLMVDDGNMGDSLWYGWKIQEPVASDVKINVKKDDTGWPDHAKKFGLKPAGNPDAALITALTLAADGEYRIYETTDADSATDTEVNVTVNAGTGSADINYYTVTFYDGSTAYADGKLAPQVVLKGQAVPDPGAPPVKDGQKFTGWVTADKGSTPHNFGATVKTRTDIYAGWAADVPAYQITYHLDGYTPAPADCQYTYGAGHTLPIPVKDAIFSTAGIQRQTIPGAG